MITSKRKLLLRLIALNPVFAPPPCTRLSQHRLPLLASNMQSTSETRTQDAGAEIRHGCQQDVLKEKRTEIVHIFQVRQTFSITENMDGSSFRPESLLLSQLV